MTNEELEFYLAQPNEEGKKFFAIKNNRPNSLAIKTFFKLKSEEQQKALKKGPKMV